VFLEGFCPAGRAGFCDAGFGRSWSFSVDALLVGSDSSLSPSPPFTSEVTKGVVIEIKTISMKTCDFLGEHTRRVSWQYHGEEE